jgi:hypothetical protein
MNAIIGKWAQIEGQPYPGLSFTFKEDGSYESEYEPMGITSSGTYSVDGDLIDMKQTQHPFGLLGPFVGRFAIEGNQLKLNLVAEGTHTRPADLNGAVIYEKVNEE